MVQSAADEPEIPVVPPGEAELPIHTGGEREERPNGRRPGGLGRARDGAVVARLMAVRDKLTK